MTLNFSQFPGQPLTFIVRSPWFDQYPCSHQAEQQTKIKMAEILSPIGLLMAAATSVSNVVKDVGAKKVVDHHEVIASTFWIRLFAAIIFIAALLVRIWLGQTPSIHNNEPLFGLFHTSPLVTWLGWLSIEVILAARKFSLFIRSTSERTSWRKRSGWINQLQRRALRCWKPARFWACPIFYRLITPPPLLGLDAPGRSLVVSFADCWTWASK